MTKVTFQMLMDQLNILYPPHLAEDWDKVGLHFVHPDAEVKKGMTVLDVRHEVIDEAIAEGVDTIIAHHPLLFRPVERFDLSIRQNELFARLIKHEIKVFVMHTNVDIAHNGMNDWLAEQLGLINIRPLEQQTTEDNPGLGRIGDLPNPLERDELLQLLKDTYRRNELAIIEREPKTSYSTIAVIGGSGTSYLNDVKQQAVDVFLTGDITYHTAQLCEDSPLMTVDVGHFTENIFTEKMAQELTKLIQKMDWSIKVIPSTININPFHYE